MKIDRQSILDKYNGHCAYCGCDITLKTMQVDHKIAQAQTKYIDHRTKRTYATFEEVYCEDNLMPSCRSCNNYKSGNSLEMFRRMIGNQIEVLRRDRPTFRLAERYGLIECKPKEIKFYFEKSESSMVEEETACSNQWCEGGFIDIGYGEKMRCSECLEKEEN